MSLRTECKGLHGTYDCVCSEEKESCHKFWCNRREVSGYVEQTLKDTPKAIETKPKLSDNPKKEENKSKTSQSSCWCSKAVLDSKTTEYFCVRKSSSMSSLINSINGCCRCKELQTVKANHCPTRKSLDFEEEMKINTSCKVHNPIDHLDNRASLKNFDSDTCPQPVGLPERVREPMEEHCYNECFDTGDPGTVSDTRELLNESCRSIETAITSRKNMDENVIPLLKNIFDVLQSIREEKLQLGSLSGKNVGIQLDEPFNGLPTPPPPVSSTPYSTTNDSFCGPEFEEKSTQYTEDCQNSMEILEPPERDVDSYQESTLQRLIPVDMGLLRTYDELSWEPVVNSDEPQFEEEETTSGSNPTVDEAVLLKAQFLKLSETPQSHSSEELKACTSKLCQGKSKNTVEQDGIEISHQDACSTNAELSYQLSIRNRSSSLEEDSCECICEDAEQCAGDCCKNSSVNESCSNNCIDANFAFETSSVQESKLGEKNGKEQLVMKFEVSQAIQVNVLSLQNMTSRSAQFLKFDSQIEELSEEKLLKTSKIDKPTEELLPTIISESEAIPVRSKVDVGTDNPDFGDEDKNQTKSCTACCHCHQEPTNPQNQDMSHFIESILSDLKAMKNVRENRSHQFTNPPRQPVNIGGSQRPSRDLSFPVTIETVQELGKNSLFIKWKIQNIGNIGGYEIFLDGHLTNRYFNCVHRAAVICDVNLHHPHRITLRAQPLLPIINTSLLTTNSTNLLACSSRMKRIPSDTTHPEASCVQADGSVWYPSVYHFEPNSYLAPTNAVLY